ncbi:hypothetical protein DFA_09888 [Cavenderia fasciculata]|uniref:Ubiquitin-like protease family profile domain-containing protein n=1 Tax=Cavenderia fasciculata TaxID=261658 RepID=F4Q8P6_CACFS|nr:uncharacterized protein DFA_09888 [Cavenderia fasciculata]EGG15065.1 hypothetical protein DFA_09888 [Cavenderia fasciculata]|eukprot:XP_004351785.1 hypothetical protein DFA_09888 [Cavenderia fasciculata]
MTIQKLGSFKTLKRPLLEMVPRNNLTATNDFVKEYLNSTMTSTKLSTNLGNELKDMVKNQRISVIDLIVSFAQDLKKKQKIGSGRSNKGLYDSEIERIMKPYHRKGFERVIASDQLNLLEPKDKMSFIMNLDPHNKPGSHWVAVYIDADKDKSVEYYDSFGQEPTDDFMKQLKDLIDEINPDYYLNFKFGVAIVPVTRDHNIRPPQFGRGLNTFELIEDDQSTIISIPVGNYSRKSLQDTLEKQIECIVKQCKYAIGWPTSQQPNTGFNKDSTNILESTNIYGAMEMMIQEVYSAAGNADFSNIHWQNYDVESYSKQLVSNTKTGFTIYLTDQDGNEKYNMVIISKVWMAIEKILKEDGYISDFVALLNFMFKFIPLLVILCLLWMSKAKVLWYLSLNKRNESANGALDPLLNATKPLARLVQKSANTPHLTDLQSFENLKGWHCETQRYCWEMVEVVIVGTKRDLVDQRKVTREQANDFALGLGCSYFEVGQDDESCIDRVYSIIARHLYENMYKDFEDNRLDLLPLHLDSISSSSSSSLSTRANTSTTTTTTTIKDQLFYSVFRSKYIRNNIFKQIPIIHSDLNVQVARGIGMPNIEFWCTNRYFNVLKYYKEKRLPIEINKFAKVSPFLRMSGNLELLQYC